ncbi:MAG TPA: S8 family serine peptidase [Actinomycetota bacterium]|nr:S8 family serine peptidase [Actinomycetota bacterium]
MKHRPVSLLLAALVAATAMSVASAPNPAEPLAGLGRILNAFQPGDIVRGIATFDAVPTRREVASLRSAGLRVQPMKRLPLALVQGPVAALKAAVFSGAANDVYADERNELYDTASTAAIGGAAIRAKGLTGKGVTVGIVDSGCDATQPDIADHVVHNVKLVSAEYLNLPPDSRNTLVVPVDALPVNNSDLTAGHGTHVAGIIAADGTSGPEHVGVAPDAELVCMAIGEGIFTTAVVTAYDYLLDQPDLLGVDVINNSWGNSFYMFDPRHPVHVATRAMVAQGVVVVFAAGNSGDSNAEMSLNLFSAAPWVISVAASSVERIRGGFSSNGLQFDNARGFSIGEGGHKAFRKDHLGIYHPDVTAPGVDISSTCSTTGVAPGPCLGDTNISASGTSMASPHVAGAAAILLQANPALTPEQIRFALQSTARPVFAEVDGKKRTLGFWQAGYGYIDLAAAVELVTGDGWQKAIVRAQRAADRRMFRSIGHRVERTDMWTYDAPPVALEGSDTRVFNTGVPAGTTHLKVTLAHPSLYAVQMNEMVYTVTIRDAAGTVLGETTEAAAGHGTSSLFVELKNAAFGVFEFEVSGIRAVSDPDNIDSESLLGRVVVLHVAQLKPLR